MAKVKVDGHTNAVPGVKARPRSGHAPQGKVHTSEPAHHSASPAGKAAHDATRAAVRENFRQNLPPRARHLVKD